MLRPLRHAQRALGEAAGGRGATPAAWDRRAGKAAVPHREAAPRWDASPAESAAAERCDVAPSHCKATSSHGASSATEPCCAPVSGEHPAAMPDRTGPTAAPQRRAALAAAKRPAATQMHTGTSFTTQMCLERLLPGLIGLAPKLHL